ncbi:MAG TPA: TRAM domain-containing protein, partial [Stellaceae bacterium]|nr:TRAM domain-containing protein [Stellaceae bacterium]
MAELTIERLGTDGVGLARHEGKIIALPYTLPGELVRIEPGKTPRLVERLSDSPDRVAPPCRHFGTCGGCQLQHLSAESYCRFKEQLALDALARHGFANVPVEPARVSPPGSRRRATIELCRAGGRVLAGF